MAKRVKASSKVIDRRSSTKKLLPPAKAPVDKVPQERLTKRHVSGYRVVATAADELSEVCRNVKATEAWTIEYTTALRNLTRAVTAAPPLAQFQEAARKADDAAWATS